MRVVTALVVLVVAGYGFVAAEGGSLSATWVKLVAPGNDGSVTVLDPATGDVVATYARDAPIFAPATLSDADGDGAAEAYVVYADGRVVRLDYGAS